MCIEILRVGTDTGLAPACPVDDELEIINFPINLFSGFKIN